MGWLLLVMLTGGVLPPDACAQSSVSLVSLQYESPGVLAPVALVVLSSDTGREWRLGVVGWTLGADWRRSDGPTRRHHLFVHVTPFNAHSSDYIYSQGERDESAEYDGSSIEVGGGLELTHRRGWVGGYRALALFESVSDLSDNRGGDAWSRPFIGLEITQQYERLTANGRFGSRLQGVKIDARAKVLTGTRTWSQFLARGGVGARTGRVHLSARGEAFAGHHLNTVSAFLVGGSWDIDYPGVLAGYRYAEFRLNRGTTLGGAVNLRMSRSWELGTRAGYLHTTDRTEYGGTVEIATMWNGVAISAGVGLPREGFAAGKWNHAVVFAACTAAIVRN
jgi:hypothetical protein